MAVVNLKISKIPGTVSEKRLVELLSTKGKVIKIQMAGTTASVQIDSDSIKNTLLQSSTRTMGLISVLYLDSTGLGELKFTTVSLV